MNPLRLVALIFAGTFALIFAGAAVYLGTVERDLVGAGVFSGLFLGAAAVVYGELKKKNTGPLLLLLAGGLGAGALQGCAGAQRTACAIWDGTHHVACRLCEQTEGGCPFGPEQGHSHEPETE